MYVYLRNNSLMSFLCVGKGKRADVYLEVRKRKGHIFFE
jgi:hypothetical protein